MKVETKTEEINWDKPQLVVSDDGTIVLTNNKHTARDFQGFKIGTNQDGLSYSFEANWHKSVFKPFHGTISNQGIKYEEQKFQPVTITIESEEELCDMWQRLEISASDVNKYLAYPSVLKYKSLYTFQVWQQIDEIVKQRNLYK